MAAGATDRIRLVSGILIAPLYQPALLAKAGAALDSMSGGRLTLGLAVGGREDDFTTAQRPLHTRGRDFDAGLELMHRDEMELGCMAYGGQGTREEVPVQTKGPVMILVTGATGTIGRPLIDVLVGEGAEDAAFRN